MNEKHISCFEPAYLEKFVCDGSVCGSKCCHKWGILIDDKTYRKYQAIEPASERDAIISHITTINDDGEEHLTFIKDECDGCSLLDDDGLCHIQRQKKYGASYLSNVCAEFPRRTYYIEGFSVRALSLVCPIAARLALISREPMTFHTVEISDERLDYFITRPAETIPAAGAFFSVFTTGVNILQNRKLTIGERLLALGLFLDYADDFVTSNDVAGLERFAENYRQPNEETFANVSASFAFDASLHFSLMTGLIDALYDDRSIYPVGNPDDYLVPFRETFGTDMEKWERGEKAYREKVVKPFDYVIENYLVNEFVGGLYPSMTNGSFFHNFIVFVTFYNVLELMLMTTAMMRDVTEDDVLRAVERLGVRTDHTLEYIRRVESYMKDKEENGAMLLTALVDASDKID